MLSTLVIVAASSAPHIDLYTMGQGDHIFERFGHAAVCVTYDEMPARSRCYNYGTTRFDAPGTLAWDFLRGDARFWVSVRPLRDTLRNYVNADRSMWRQRLPLTGTQVEAFVEKLEFDALEQNRYYVYHHFFDNCTTRIRDILDDVTDGRLSRQGARPLGWTYRELGARGLAEHTLARVVSDFALGRPADAPITVYDGMFHPKILREEVAAAYGSQPGVVNVRRGPPFPQSGTTGRHWTSLLAALVVAPVVAGEWFAARRRFFLALTGTALGLIAAVLWALAIVSAVPELRYNEALLLFWPTDFVLPLLGARAVRRYARVRLLAVLLVSLLTTLGVLWQPLYAPMLLPLAVFGVLAWPSPDEAGVPRGRATPANGGPADRVVRGR